MSWSADRAVRSRAVEGALAAGVLLATVGSLELWWGGSAPPGRPLVSALPLLGLPIAWQYRRSAARPAVRAAYQVLVLAGAATSCTILLAQNGLLLAERRDGSSVFLRYLSPLWHADLVMPSFFPANQAHAPGLAVLWTIAALVVAGTCARNRSRTAGAAALVAATSLGYRRALVSAVASAGFENTAQPRWNPAARSRVPLLDTFDARAHPLAIVYDPFRIVDPTESRR